MKIRESDVAVSSYCPTNPFSFLLELTGRLHFLASFAARCGLVAGQWSMGTNVFHFRLDPYNLPTYLPTEFDA